MILSNLSSSVDVESRAMATMGDTLGRSGWTRKRGLGLGAPARELALCPGCPCVPGSAVLSWSPSPPAFSPLSLQRAHRCCALLLPHGPGRIWGVHLEDRKACLNWVKPQVRDMASRHPHPLEGMRPHAAARSRGTWGAWRFGFQGPLRVTRRLCSTVCRF